MVFLLKDSQAVGKGSVGIDEISSAEPVRIRVCTTVISLVSNYFLLADEDAALAIIKFDTSWPRHSLIWYITLGGPVRSSTSMGLGGSGMVRILLLLSGVDLSEIS